MSVWNLFAFSAYLNDLFDSALLFEKVTQSNLKLAFQRSLYLKVFCLKKSQLYNFSEESNDTAFLLPVQTVYVTRCSSMCLSLHPEV